GPGTVEVLDPVADVASERPDVADERDELPAEFAPVALERREHAADRVDARRLVAVDRGDDHERGTRPRSPEPAEDPGSVETLRLHSRSFCSKSSYATPSRFRAVTMPTSLPSCVVTGRHPIALRRITSIATSVDVSGETVQGSFFITCATGIGFDSDSCS